MEEPTRDLNEEERELRAVRTAEAVERAAMEAEKTLQDAWTVFRTIRRHFIDIGPPIPDKLDKK